MFLLNIMINMKYLMLSHRLQLLFTFVNYQIFTIINFTLSVDLYISKL